MQSAVVEITNFHTRYFKICMYNCTFLHANKNLVFALLEKVFVYLSMHTQCVCNIWIYIHTYWLCLCIYWFYMVHSAHFSFNLINILCLIDPIPPPLAPVDWPRSECLTGVKANRIFSSLGIQNPDDIQSLCGVWSGKHCKTWAGDIHAPVEQRKPVCKEKDITQPWRDTEGNCWVPGHFLIFGPSSLLAQLPFPSLSSLRHFYPSNKFIFLLILAWVGLCYLQPKSF